MADNRRLIELALKGLEAERSKIDQEIKELTSQIGGDGAGKPRTNPNTRTAVAGGTRAGNRLIATKPQRKGTLTAAGRKKLSEAAKKRWAANRKTGRTTL